MVDVKKLKAKMIISDVSVEDISKAFGTSLKTTYTRFRRKIFSSDEIEKLMYLLGIVDPNEIMEIFFADTVTCRATRDTA